MRMIGRTGAVGLRQSARKVHGILLEDLACVGSSERAHVLAQWMASFLLANSCGIYRCDELEELLLSHCGLDLGRLRAQVSASTGVLHVLSEAYSHGGHTRVARHFLAQADGPQCVLLTRPSHNSQVHQWLGVDSDCVRQHLGELSSAERISVLAVDIAGHSEVILYLHPEDVIGGAAVRLAKRLNPALRIGFFDHADHAFSVGIGAANCVFEISTYGWQLRHARDVGARASFVGIPIQASLPAGGRGAADGAEPKALLVGTPYKFRPVGDRKLFYALDALLAANPKLSVDCVGPEGFEAWWQPLRAKFEGRIRFHGFLAHDRYMTLLDSAALYVDSYPKTGGTAFPEALLAGGGVTGLFGGTWGFSVADVLRVDGVAAFVDRCSAILRRDPQVLALMRSTRQDCATYHSPTAVWARIVDGLRSGVLHAPPPALANMPEPPILAEREWETHGKLVMRLPDRRSPQARWIHRVLWRMHVQAFGALHPGSMRWAFTWLWRYAWRSG